MVSQEIIDANFFLESTRALNQMTMARETNEMCLDVIEPGPNIIVVIKSSKQNENDEWLPAVVVNIPENTVVCGRNAKGASMNVS